jgi:HSP20 family protein
MTQRRDDMATPTRRRNGGTDLAQRDPFDELNQLTNQLQNFFGGTGLPSILEEGFTPLADIEETDDAYVVDIELPGVRKEDVSVEMSGRRLVVTGERKEKERKGILRRQTRTVGRFRYEVVLPGDVNDAGIDASLDHGVLSIRIPKADAERPHRITVQ